jgi:hypothetical protein
MVVEVTSLVVAAPTDLMLAASAADLVVVATRLVVVATSLVVAASVADLVGNPFHLEIKNIGLTAALVNPT